MSTFYRLLTGKMVRDLLLNRVVFPADDPHYRHVRPHPHDRPATAQVEGQASRHQAFLTG